MAATSTERVRKYRANNPIRATYYNLKNNAKRRNKDFQLTFEEFGEFATKYQINYGKKRTKDTWSIDRVDPSKGYSIDNIQPLTLSENSEKRWSDMRVFEFTNDYTAARIKVKTVPNYTDIPF